MPTKHTIPFSQAIQSLPLTQIQLTILKHRYEPLLHEYKKRAYLYAALFHSLRAIMTIGSLVVPALLSVNFGTSSNTEISSLMYWLTWSISLCVTTSNGILTLFKIDKKYHMIHTIYEQLQSEGWQYLELTGRYSGFYTPMQKPTYENQFRYFCHAVEKIKMKQVEEEYFKVQESGHTHSHQGQQDSSKPALAHPTPAVEALQQFLTKQKGNGSSNSASALAPTIEETVDEEEEDAAERASSPASQTNAESEKPPASEYSTLSPSSPLYKIHASEFSKRGAVSV